MTGTEILTEEIEETETDEIITTGIATIKAVEEVTTTETGATTIGATMTEIISTAQHKIAMMTDVIIGATVDATKEDVRTIAETETDATTE